ncbi:hypothetical protein RKD05_000294 [Microbacterium sp. SLBN-111]
MRVNPEGVPGVQRENQVDVVREEQVATFVERHDGVRSDARPRRPDLVREIRRPSRIPDVGDHVFRHAVRKGENDALERAHTAQPSDDVRQRVEVYDVDDREDAGRAGIHGGTHRRDDFEHGTGGVQPLGRASLCQVGPHQRDGVPVFGHRLRESATDDRVLVEEQRIAVEDGARDGWTPVLDEEVHVEHVGVFRGVVVAGECRREAEPVRRQDIAEAVLDLAHAPVLVWSGRQR